MAEHLYPIGTGQASETADGQTKPTTPLVTVRAGCNHRHQSHEPCNTDCHHDEQCRSLTK